MGKVDLNLSYKDCCIVKHTLERSIELKSIHVIGNKCINRMRSDVVTNKELENDIKEIEEEKRALESITEQIENWKERNHIK